MNPGDFRHRLEFFRVDTVDDAGGGGAESEVLVAKVLAKVETLTEREIFRNRQAADSSTHRFTFHYRRGLSTALRVRFGARVFKLTSLVNVNEENFEMVALAEELVE